ncbi:adhesion G protein-coupled receptor E1 isoform X2 [Nematostella vectensis]|uniref:adhesion G protein-coupled receptor E1 isoform X2 n=1 Tax=Nematostella vectensis TaxID=45351 RepID=UPI0020776A4B|nr:adhesion G protein-coupled receptor E1 isoform X2 [Nematostella vectensis]
MCISGLLHLFLFLAGIFKSKCQDHHTIDKECPIFEFDGSLPPGWTPSGEAFSRQPVFMKEISGLPANSWLLDSSRLEPHFPCDRDLPATRHDIKGTLTSPEFLIRHVNINFLIAGGCNSSKERVELWIGNTTVATATADCTVGMTEKHWHLQQGYHNKNASIRLVDDDVTSPWGYISLGRVTFEKRCEDLPPCLNDQPHCRGKTEASGGLVCHCPTDSRADAVASSVCGTNSSCLIPGGACQSYCSSNVTACTCSKCECVSGYLYNATSHSCSDVDECAMNSGGCQYACVNTDGGYHCACADGYEVSGDGKTCGDKDECKVNKGGCQNAECVNSQGSFDCMCHNGWVHSPDNRLLCVDRDECAEDTSARLCGDTQVCINTEGSYKCGCRPGFLLLSDQRKCIDQDECADANGGCAHDCHNTQGSFSCSCRSGFALASDKRACRDIDECKTNNGGCSQRCLNTNGSRACACDAGYDLEADGVTCVDIDECKKGAKCQYSCTNTNGSFYCSCRHGYALQADNTTCADINECVTSNGNCSHTCVNWEGGFNCTCAEGYALTYGGYECVDIDECSSKPCDHTCRNTNGSFVCSCREGFRLLSDNTTCRDIDECEELKKTSLSCGQRCLNFPGGYNCTCNSGFILIPDNRTCNDTDECLDSNTCQQTCTNLPGSYRCSCYKGYELDLDGKTCSDKDECKTGSNCSQLCTNTAGGYQCSCHHGYVLSANQHACVDVDECARVHGCQDSCLNSPGSYKCACSDGKLLAMDGKSCKEMVPVTKAIDEAQKDIEASENTEQLTFITKSLLDVLQDQQNMTTKEVEDTVSVMDNITHKLTSHVPESAQVIKNLVTNFVGIMIHVLAPEKVELMKTDKGVMYTVPQKVEEMMEVAYSRVRNDSKSELSVDITGDVLDVKLTVTTQSAFHGYHYHVNSTGNGLTVPRSVVDGMSDSDYICISVVVFKTLGDVEPSDKEPQPSNKLTLRSDIINLQLINVNKSKLSNLKEPIQLRFSNSMPFLSGTPLCGFIDETAAAMKTGDLWSVAGCKVASTSANHTVCECSHLTSYGLLMDVHGIYDDLSDAEKDALKYISLVGCIISIVFCGLAILAFTLAMNRPMERKGRVETYVLHVNLVTAIGISQICFIIGTFTVGADLITCRVVSICTHYFLSASFSWMLVEGINVYNKIVKVFSTRKYSKYYFTLGWGLPVILVTVTAAVAFDKYGPGKICWLSQDIIWVFAAPVLAVIVANSFVLMSIIYVLVRKTINIKAGPNKNDETTKVRRSVKVSVVLLPLLGITWVFGFLAVDKNLIAFHFIFAIVNSLQGLFIFIAHCWINDSVKSALLDKLPSIPLKTKYNIKKLRGGSGTSQQNTMDTSANFDTVNNSVTAPVHITMSTVQLLNFGRAAKEKRTSARSSDTEIHGIDNAIPGTAYDEL